MPYLAALNWRLIGLCAAAFAVLALFAHDRIQVSKVGKLQAELKSAQGELIRISTAKDKQGKETTGNIVKAKERGTEADRKARNIEAAPLPGNCSTPKAILESDI